MAWSNDRDEQWRLEAGQAKYVFPSDLLSTVILVFDSVLVFRGLQVHVHQGHEGAQRWNLSYSEGRSHNRQSPQNVSSTAQPSLFSLVQHNHLLQDR